MRKLTDEQIKFIDYLYEDWNFIYSWDEEYGFRMRRLDRDMLYSLYENWMSLNYYKELCSYVGMFYNKLEYLDSFNCEETIKFMDNFQKFKTMCDKCWIEVDLFSKDINIRIAEFNNEQFKKIREQKNISCQWAIYVIRDEKWKYKIWKTKSFKDRYKKYITENSGELEVAVNILCEDYDSRELEVHDMFKEKRIRGEWFELEENDIVTIKLYLQKYEIVDEKIKRKHTKN